MSEENLVDLEERGWRALSTSGASARAFYESVLDRTVVMLLPGGMVLDDRATILDSMSGQPWSFYDLTDLRELRPTRDTGLVTYRAFAHREGAGPYSALVSSLYARRDDGWRLIFHQQTPT
ncbi:MAG TPA: nuclear transport factor 2 family protein [Nocardioidaceae bacterium]